MREVGASGGDRNRVGGGGGEGWEGGPRESETKMVVGRGEVGDGG